tara:strand:+ start:249 stop:497 length:249 start_codon:yes stop_codon:yes gene_type:complete
VFRAVGTVSARERENSHVKERMIGRSVTVFLNDFSSRSIDRKSQGETPNIDKCECLLDTPELFDVQAIPLNGCKERIPIFVS